MLKREAEAAGASIHVARATAPHYQNIQNVRFSRCPNDLTFNLTCRRPVSLPPKSLKVPNILTTNWSVRTSGKRNRK